MSSGTRVGTWRWEASAKRLVRDGMELPRTEREQEVVAYLVARLGRVVETPTLQQEVLGYAPRVKSRAVENLISRLRRKLGPDARQLQTVYGRGYVLVPTIDDDLIGRDEAVVEVEGALHAHGLVSIVAIGGMGKTRLARAVADRAPRATWVAADGVHTIDDLAQALASALDLPRVAGEERLRDALVQDGPALLVLDRVEDMEPAALAWLAGWSAGYDLRVLATSRRALGDECQYALAPLGSETAARLLAHRCEAALPAPVLTAAERGAILDRLDGIPLAIELAAARLQVLPPGDLLFELDQPSAAIRSILDAAWDGLTPLARTVLARLALFPGAVRPSEIRQAVPEPGDPAPGEADEAGEASEAGGASMVEALEALRRAGLIHRDGRAVGLLDRVRVYARSRVTAVDERAFLRHVVAEAEGVHDASVRYELVPRDRAHRVAELCRAALPLAEQPVDQAQLVIAIHQYDEFWGPLLDSRERLERLSIASLPDALAAEVRRRQAILYVAANERPRGLACVEEAVALARRAGHAERLTRALSYRVTYHRMVRGAEATLPLAQAFAVHAATPPTTGIRHADGLKELANCLTPLGRFEEAHRLYLQCLTLVAERPDRLGMIRTRLGFVCMRLGRYDEALAHLQSALDIAREEGSAKSLASVGLQLGEALAAAGQADAAACTFREALEASRQVSDTLTELNLRIGLAVLEPEPHRARSELEAVREAAYLAKRPREVAAASFHLGQLAHTAGDLPAADRHLTEGIGAIASIGWAAMDALLLRQHALVQAELGDPESARATLAQVPPETDETARANALVAAAIGGNVARVRAMLEVEPPRGRMLSVADFAMRVAIAVSAGAEP